jgi:hypothetical protein
MAFPRIVFVPLPRWRSGRIPYTPRSVAKTLRDKEGSIEPLARLFSDLADLRPDVERPEAAKLIEVSERALDVFRCDGCNQPLWMADAANKEWVQCQCGELRWRYGKG